MAAKVLFRIFAVIGIAGLWVPQAQGANISSNVLSQNYSPEEPRIIVVSGASQADLQSAILAIPDRGVIEMGSGVYQAPPTGFQIGNMNKSFTIQAAPGANVVLNGANSTTIVDVYKTPSSIQGSITFKGVTFANGRESAIGTGAGLSITNSKVTFIDCVFENNTKTGYRVNTTAGALFIEGGSTVFIFDSVFRNNTSEDGGAALATRDSTVFIHNTQFIGNRTLATSTSSIPVGGALNIVNSTARITNSRFEDNRAAGHGAAVYILGQWSASGSNVLISNSTFINNRIERNLGYNAPIEGGAINIEDNSLLKIYNSRFIKNAAGIGGAVNIFRAKTEIYNSVFLGNRATDTTPSSGFGGAISFNFYDQPANSRLLIEDSFIQGRYENITTVAQYGGGIHAHGNPTSNKPPLTLRRVILNDLDTTTSASKAAAGGAVEISWVNFTMEDSFMLNNDARGSMGGFGGGLIAYAQTNVNIARSVIANNTTDYFGGGLSIIGSQINISDTLFFNNDVSPGSVETAPYSYGAAIYTSPDNGSSTPVSGSVSNSTFVKNIGIPIYDDDRSSGPINSIVYNNNRFFETSYPGKVYHDSLTPVQTVEGLNSLIVIRSGSSTDKSPLNDNEVLQSEPIIAMIQGAPTSLLPILAAGDTDTTTSYFAYVWNGSSAALDNNPLPENVGVIPITSPGDYTLNVDGTIVTRNLILSPEPSIITSVIPGSPNPSLSWDVTSGNFLHISADQGLILPVTPSGIVALPSKNSNYYVYSVTREGGVRKSVDPRRPLLNIEERLYVLIGMNRPQNSVGALAWNGGGDEISWSAQSNSPELLEMIETSGTFVSHGIIPLLIKANQPGQYTGQISIDGGIAGVKLLNIEISVIDFVHHLYLPGVIK